MKWYYPLAAALNNLGGCVMFVWARSIKPHTLAFERIGIRIANPDRGKQSTGSSDSQDVYRALLISTILNGRFPSRAGIPEDHKGKYEV